MLATSRQLVQTTKARTPAPATQDTAVLDSTETAPTSTNVWTTLTPTDATRSPRATTPLVATHACALTVSQGTDMLTVPDALTSTSVQTLKLHLALGTLNVPTITVLTPVPARQDTKEMELFALSHFLAAT